MQAAFKGNRNERLTFVRTSWKTKGNYHDKFSNTNRDHFIRSTVNKHSSNSGSGPAGRSRNYV